MTDAWRLTFFDRLPRWTRRIDGHDVYMVCREQDAEWVCYWAPVEEIEVLSRGTDFMAVSAEGVATMQGRVT